LIKTDILNVRDRIELHITDKESESIFSVRVQEIDESRIVIDRRLMPSKLGDEVTLIFHKNDAAYRFQAKVLEETYLERLPVLKVEQPKKLERMQRRSYFRLDLDRPLLLRKQIGERKLDEDEPYLRATIADLSAGGVKFRVLTTASSELEDGNHIQLVFKLNENESIMKLRAQILKIAENENSPLYKVAFCRFLDITTKIQEAIIVHNIRFQRRYQFEKKKPR
jgi:c-di-GMP-binding flagellar brake protein YcgR